MKTSFDILDKVYPILAVPATVTGVIDGRVCRGKKPPDSQLQDIVIFTLGIKNADGIMFQPGTFFVNMFCENYSDGRPNEKKLRQITEAVVSTLEAWNDTTGNYFVFDVINQSVFQDQSNPVMSYSSLRVNFNIEK